MENKENKLSVAELNDEALEDVNGGNDITSASGSRSGNVRIPLIISPDVSSGQE